MPAQEISRIWCNTCGGNTRHDEVCRETTDNDGNPEETLTASVLRCLGCRTWTIREARELRPASSSVAGSAEGGQQAVADGSLRFIPPRVWRRPPEWLGQLEFVAPDLRGLLDEVYQAAHDGQSRLLSMGVRAALDQVMIAVVGDSGSFEQKLEDMVMAGHLSRNQKISLSVIIDAGSASAHRGFRPARDLLQEMLVAMESVIRNHYLTSPMLTTLKGLIPPKPPRPARRPPTKPPG